MGPRASWRAEAEQLPLSTNQCSRSFVRRRRVRYRSRFAAVYYLAGTKSGCRGNVPRPETRRTLLHRRTALCLSGVDSTFRHVAAGWVKSISERLSRALQSDRIFDACVRESLPGTTMEKY